MKNTILSIVLVSCLSGCGTISSASLSSSGSNYIGRSASDLFAGKGTPSRQVISPTGATIYVYEAHNLIGATFCEGSFYIRNGMVVGFTANGQDIVCGGTAGNIQ